MPFSITSHRHRYHHLSRIYNTENRQEIYWIQYQQPAIMIIFLMIIICSSYNISMEKEKRSDIAANSVGCYKFWGSLS